MIRPLTFFVGATGLVLFFFWLGGTEFVRGPELMGKVAISLIVGMVVGIVSILLE